MIALMPVICWNTARPRPTISGRRHAGANTSRHDAFGGSSRERGLDRREPHVRIDPRPRAHDRRARLVAAARAHQPARRLHRRHHRDQQQQGRDGRHAEHRCATSPASASAASIEIRQEDADRDRELVARHEAAALRGGRELGRVERRGDRRDADAEARRRAARATRTASAGRQRFDRRARREQRARPRCSACRRPSRSASSPPASDPDQRAQRHPARHDLDQQRRELEVALHARRARPRSRPGRSRTARPRAARRPARDSAATSPRQWRRARLFARPHGAPSRRQLRAVAVPRLGRSRALRRDRASTSCWRRRSRPRACRGSPPPPSTSACSGRSITPSPIMPRSFSRSVVGTSQSQM